MAPIMPCIFCSADSPKRTTHGSDHTADGSDHTTDHSDRTTDGSDGTSHGSDDRSADGSNLQSRRL